MNRHLALVIASCLVLSGCDGEPSAGDTWTRPEDGSTMVFVPAGEFLMGSTPADIEAALAGCSECDPEWFANEQPQHTVYLDAFWIDETEVTNRQYRQCMEAGACQEPGCWQESALNTPEQPVVCVNWHEARAYADWVGGRLPTEAEWEKAARGTDGRVYPWGATGLDCLKTNYSACSDRPLPVGSHPAGASPYGAQDMVGNAWEWVADWVDDGYYAHSPGRNPQGPDSGERRVWKGGSFTYEEWVARCAVRGRKNPTDRHADGGFRVVVNAGQH